MMVKRMARCILITSKSIRTTNLNQKRKGSALSFFLTFFSACVIIKKEKELTFPFRSYFVNVERNYIFFYPIIIYVLIDDYFFIK